MSILARVRANGGDVIRDSFKFSLRRGRLADGAVQWLRENWRDACREAWPPLDRWEERAAIREYDGGLPRAAAERAAYDEVAPC